ncbi:MAG TPA: hypothetical protein VF168_13985 [Trueperaceae bacterium]
MGDPYLLLIEENPDDVYLTLRELRRYGAHTRVQVITDSATALEHLLEAEELPSALLLGLKFVRLSGVELLAELRSHERTRDLPVVLLTAGQEERERVGREVNYAKPVACLDKPLRFGLLASVLGNLGVAATAAVA